MPVHFPFERLPRLSVVATLAAVLIGAYSTVAYAQSPERTGSVAGTVRRAWTGESAEGAHVQLLGTAFSTVVGHDGTFRFTPVPVGTYRLNVVGLGMTPQTIDYVRVLADSTTRVAVTVYASSLPQEDPVSTPGKRMQTARETSASVTVIPASDIRLRNATTLDRIVAYAPGVNINGTQIGIRGSDGCSFLAGGNVLMLVDGVPFVAPDNGRIPVTTLPLAAAEHIEILRGAASSIHGSGAVGGTINLVTRDPAEGPQGFIRGYTGFYTAPDVESWNWNGGTIQRFNGIEGLLARKAGPVGIVLSGNYLRDDGFRQFDQSERYNLFGKIDWNFGATANFRLGVFNAQDDRESWNGWRSYDSALFAPAIASDSVPIHQIRANTAVTSELNVHASESFWWILRGIYQRLSLTDTRSEDDPNRLDEGAARVFGEAQFNSRVNPRLLVTYGGALAFDIGEGSSFGGRVLRTTSFYGNVEFGNGRDISTNVGARVDMLLAPGAEIPTETQLSPRVGVAYRPLPTTALRVSIARGFRAPSLAERYSNTTVLGLHVRPNPELRPEQSWQGEVGASHEVKLPMVRFIGDAAVYMDEYFSMIEPVLSGNEVDVSFQNLTRARMLGADLSLRAEISGAPLELSATITRVIALDLKNDRAVPCRPGLVLHFELGWTPAPFGLFVDLRHSAAPEEVPAVMVAAIPDASVLHGATILDAHMRLELARLIDVPLSGQLSARNLLQSDGTDGVGSIVPLRSFEAGVELRF